MYRYTTGSASVFGPLSLTKFKHFPVGLCFPGFFLALSEAAPRAAIKSAAVGFCLAGKD